MGTRVHRIIKNCEICGKEFTTMPSEIRKGWGRFCDRKCLGQHNKVAFIGPANSQWNGGYKVRIKTYKCKTPERRKIARSVSIAVLKGILVKKPCCVCGTLDMICAHHEDYSKPLDVVWICSKHHAELHQMKKKTALTMQFTPINELAPQKR